MAVRKINMAKKLNRGYGAKGKIVLSFDPDGFVPVVDESSPLCDPYDERHCKAGSVPGDPRSGI
jgi:hypothetical protein